MQKLCMICLELKNELSAKQFECQQLNTRVESKNSRLKVNWNFSHQKYMCIQQSLPECILSSSETTAHELTF